MRICIIAVWFGTLPTSFRAWALSAAYNRGINFLFVTDQPVDIQYDNIQVLHYSFANFCEMIKMKLGDDIVLDRPYKLCDYKPAYGEIFEEYLGEYEYWGYCDIDLVFGDLLSSFKNYSLDKYDKFLRLGHLTIYKNKPDLVQLYRHSENWEITSHTERITIFDERQVGGVHEQFIINEYDVFEKRIFVDITRYKNRFTSIIRSKKEDRSYRFEIYIWENGKLYRVYFKGLKCKSDEILYVHFQKRIIVDHVDWKEEPKCFSLSRYGIEKLDSKDKVNLGYIFKRNPYKGCVVEKIEEILMQKKENPYLYSFKRLYNRTAKKLKDR